jgi:hypothetical protein
MDDFEDKLENLKKHILDAGRQNWLFGAGISLDAKIPLMYPLTERVEKIIDGNNIESEKSILSALKHDLEKDSHIEHYLSHLGDLIAIAERSKEKTATLNEKKRPIDELKKSHISIVKAIGETVRYGYKDDSEIGTAENPIVEVNHHLSFVEALFLNRSNLERRSKITFFTTNYDTLLEDALALCKKQVIDGFSGGAVGYWNPIKEYSQCPDDSSMYFLYKLHGSVDWHHDKNRGLVRARYGTKYLSDPSNIMIYPQATKYVETQKDPFASLFTGLRSTLNIQLPNVLITCGYSFGDSHINAEIEACLTAVGNNTTVIIFINECPNDVDGIVISPILDKWLKHSEFGKRVFIAGKKGLYNNSITPSTPEDGAELDWWKFSGLTKFLKTGEVK